MRPWYRRLAILVSLAALAAAVLATPGTAKASASPLRYVALGAVSEGHDACEPIGVRWIEPVLQGTNPVILHPNSLGEAHMASQTMTVLRLR
jgi:hypothetical protein